MDEKQDTAVRHLKKQNGTKCRNLVSLDCKLRYKTGGQRSQADSVANLPDNSDKFCKRNPKIDFRVTALPPLDKTNKVSYTINTSQPPYGTTRK